ncbi:hypothetical protein AAC387_Pa05g0340 [Persea americana]
MNLQLQSKIHGFQNQNLISPPPPTCGGHSNVGAGKKLMKAAEEEKAEVMRREVKGRLETEENLVANTEADVVGVFGGC